MEMGEAADRPERGTSGYLEPTSRTLCSGKTSAEEAALGNSEEVRTLGGGRREGL